MRILKRITLSLLVLMCLTPVTSAAKRAPQKDLKLWYNRPASQWIEALPLGNGRIGVMVFGGVEEELIQLNEGTLWSGNPVPQSVNPEASSYLEPLRNALFRGDYDEADQLARKMQGNFTESFMPLGDLVIRQQTGSASPAQYYRELDIQNAVSTTRFTVEGTEYTRELFVSAPDRAVVLKISASKARSLTLDLNLRSPLLYHVFVGAENELKMSGTAPARVDPSYYHKQGREESAYIDENGNRGMRFQTNLRVKAKDGSVHTDTLGIHIRNASEVIVYLTAATSFNGFDKDPNALGKEEGALADQALNQAQKYTYTQLLKRHTQDYQSFFNRLTLQLCGDEPASQSAALPSDARLQAYSQGASDPDLESLYFQFGRYLLISSSRPGGTAANLQGLWNKEFRPPWSSNYTININTEMNYWPSEVCNLSEMHQPLLDFISGTLAKTGTRTAREFYDARGWVAHHNSDIWGLSNPVGNKGDGDPVWSNWQMGGHWLCQHLWEHYAFTGDKEYLRTQAYPVMKEAALFCFDWLVEKDGYLVTAPGTSPENNFRLNGKNYAVGIAPTMDLSIIWDLFTNLIEASEVLETDEAFRRELIAKRSNLFPLQVGGKGQLQEWNEDFQETDLHHRHVSHLFGLYPGREINSLIDTRYADACRRTLEIRGDDGTGWSKGWKINLWARLLDGDKAYELVRQSLNYTQKSSGVTGGGVYPNFFSAHPPFQIDGNFGTTSGIAEMLLQSHAGEVHLLPALPRAWKQGSIQGLKARKGFEVGISWTDHRLATATIQSLLGGECVVRTNVPVTVKGAKTTVQRIGEYYLTSFQTKQGKTYQVQYAPAR